MKTIDTLDNQPFRNLITTIGALPTSFIDSMSYYEMLAWLVNYLETQVIPAVNNNAEALKEVEAAIVELKKYVDEYFDNLDIQTEVDNKLDEMAESGELAEIIAQYVELAGVLGFTTVSDMANADNLVNGSICRTLGQNDKDDGHGAYYKVRQLLNTDVVDGVNIITVVNSDNLIAERIKSIFDKKLEAYYLYGGSGLDFGDSTVYLGDKNIIVDFGNDNHTTNDFLNTKSVKKIDAIVITHYHNDHIGTYTGAGLEAVLSNPNIDFSDCVVYLPHKGNDYSQWTNPTDYEGEELAVRAILTSHNMTVVNPDNEQKVDLNNDISLQFFNIGSAFYSNYYNILFDSKTDANNFSMLTLIKAYGKTFLNGGDMSTKACELNAEYAKNIDVYHTLHHGTNQHTPMAWNINLSPKFAVISRRTGNGTDGTRYHATDLVACGSNGAILLDVMNAEQNICVTATELDVYSDIASNVPLTSNVTTDPENALITPMDLNNLTSCGTYTIPSGELFSQFTNIPPAVFSTDYKYTGGRIDVIAKTTAGNNTGLMQIVTFQNLTTNLDLIFYRSYGTNSWNSWKFVKTGVANDSDFSIAFCSGSGFITGGTKDLKLWIPYTDYISDGNETITLNSFSGISVRIPTGGYLLQSVASSDTDYTYTIQRGSQSGFLLIIKKANDTAWSVPNNSTCVYELYGGSFHIGAR